MKGSLILPPGIRKSLKALRLCSGDFHQSLLLSNILPQSLRRRPPLSIHNSLPSCAKFFQYTSSRWLWDEEQQLRDQYTPFNVPELQKAAAYSIRAKECIKITKLAEGSFNKTFKLSIDNGLNVITRIPHPITGPEYYITASKVATIEDKLGRIAIMKDLVSLEKKMLSVSLNRNLYFANKAIQGAAAADIIGNMPEESKKAVISHFIISPHTDLHPGNLFQGIWAAPLLLRARHPHLINYQGDIILKPLANFNNLDTEEKKIIREKMSKSIVIYLYEKQIAKEVPLLNRVLHLNHSQTRCDPIQFIGDTWDDDIIPLRDGLTTHEEESEGWNDVQEFWNSVANIVTREGWTPNHLYNNAITLFAELRNTGLKTMSGKEREDFKKQTQWVEKA
ncbi:hypothetical protein V8F44DRAFT_650908 [Aspergillus fumigatus]